MTGDETDPAIAEGENRSLTRHTLHGVFWITMGRLLKAPVNLIAVAVLARMLTPSDFGVIAIGMIVVSLSNVMVDGSFGMILIQRRELDPKVIGASVALSSAMAVLFAVVIVAVAPFVEREFNFPQLSNVLIALGGVLPVTAVTMITTALLQRSFQFGTLTINSLLAQVCYAATGIALAFTGYGLWSLVWAQVVSFTVEAGLGFLAVRNRYNVQISTAAMKDVLKSGGLFTLSRLLNLGATTIDRIVIGRFLGAAQLGLYNRASTLLVTAREVTGAGPIRVLFSTFAKIQHHPERLARAYLRALTLSLIVAALVSAFVVVNSEVIVRILLGPRWLQAIPLLQVLFSAFIARIGYVVAEAVPLALGLSGQSALRQGAQFLLVTIGAVAGTPFGVLGATIGIAVGYWIFYFLCLLLVQKLLPVKWSEIFRLHLNCLLVAFAPTFGAVAARLLIGGHNVFLELIPAAIFGLVSAAVLMVAPAWLVSEDIVRARRHALQKLRTLIPRLA